MKLNTDFGMAGMSSQDLQAVVAAWQSGAISRDTMFELFRSGEILPDGRTNQDEAELIRAGTGGNGANREENRLCFLCFPVLKTLPVWSRLGWGKNFRFDQV